MRRKKPTIATTWEVWGYDVWGNRKDGWDVNDRFCIHRSYEIDLSVEVNNPGTEGEFLSAYPTDTQIRQAFGLRWLKLSTNGDDVRIDVEHETDGFPIGEMVCTSHCSLSPIAKA